MAVFIFRQPSLNLYCFPRLYNKKKAMNQQKQLWISPKQTRNNSKHDNGLQTHPLQGTHNNSSLSQNLEIQVAFNDYNCLKSQQRGQPSPSAEIKCQEWTTQEENLLIELHNKKGNKWVQIARQLKRNDNAVKNHYHSRLRKTLRKLNKCITDHLKGQFRLLKSNLISKIVQTAQQLYQTKQCQQKESSLKAYALKNKVLNYAYINQQQISFQQLIEIKKLVSQIQEFDNLLKNSHTTDHTNKTISNKYKGKEIIGLLNQNRAENIYNQNKKSNKNSAPPPLYAESSEEHSLPPLPHDKLKNTQTQNAQAQKPSLQNLGVYNNCPTILFFNEPFYPMQSLFYPIYQPSTGIFSGRQSSFSSYSPQNESGTENMSQWATSSRLQEAHLPNQLPEFKRRTSFDNNSLF